MLHLGRAPHQELALAPPDRRCDHPGGEQRVDPVAQIVAARQLYLYAARRKDAGKPFSTEAAMAKLIATDAAMKVTTDMVQVLGGAGYVEDHPLERYMREAKVLQIVEGTNQIQRVVIARSLKQAPRRQA